MQEDISDFVSAVKLGIKLPRNLQEIKNINQVDENKLSLLMIACQSGNDAAVEALLQHPDIKVDLDNGPPNYENALIISASTEFPSTKKIIQRLVKHPSIDSKSLDRALIYFSSIGDVDMVNCCLEKGANINAEYLNNSALTEAVEHEHLKVVKRLLQELNINVNKGNYREETPLIISICKKNIDIFNALLNLSPKNEPCKLDYVSLLFGTPLTAAIFFGLNDLAIELIEKDTNFDPNKHPGALNWAIRKENVELTKKLIECGASVNELGNKYYPNDLPEWLWQEVEPSDSPFYPNRRKPVFELPIFLALQTRNKALIELVLPYADVHKKGAFGQSALEFVKQEEVDIEIRNRIEKSENSVAVNNKFQFFLNSNEKQPAISEESLKMFKGAFELLISSLSDINEQEKNILLSFLKDENYTPEEIISFSKELSLPLPLANSMDILYCAFHSKKWETAVFIEYKKYLLDGIPKLSLSSDSSKENLEKRIDQFKIIAKTTVSELLKSEIILNEKEGKIKEKIILKLKQEASTKKKKNTISKDQKISAKGMVDDYLEACCAEYGEYGYESGSDMEISSDSLESPRENEEKIKEIELKLQKFSSEIQVSFSNKWKSLNRYSDDGIWKDIYILIKFPKNSKMPRNENDMFEVVKAILYQQETECSWKKLPQDFIPGGQAYYYKCLWESENKLQKIIDLVNVGIYQSHINNTQNTCTKTKLDMI